MEAIQRLIELHQLPKPSDLETSIFNALRLNQIFKLSFIEVRKLILASYKYVLIRDTIFIFKLQKNHVCSSLTENLAGFRQGWGSHLNILLKWGELLRKTICTRKPSTLSQSHYGTQLGNGIVGTVVE